jgi:LmbE family N-acetylglucosaminyl deacetylase
VFVREASPAASIELRPGDRVLFVAPHPDDEALGGGGLLQRARCSCARVEVVFVTDGENNPWAQRASERRLRIAPADRARFGRKRRAEALASLGRLGVAADAATFLGLPDQGITDLLVRDSARFLDPFGALCERLRPSVLVAPSPADLHPDHSACAVLLDLAEVARRSPPPWLRLSYLVHHPARRRPASGGVIVDLADDELIRKRAAVDCHRSQRVLRGPWMAGFVSGDERFFTPDDALAAAPHPIRSVRGRGDVLELEISSHSRPGAFGRRTMVVVVATPDRPTHALVAPLPGSRRSVTVTDATTDEALAEGRWLGRSGRGTLVVPSSLFPSNAAVFAKLERRFGFFDEAGWRRVERGTFGSGER